jgi:peptidyl-tRNA hydrolase, PTH1 family
MTIKIIVGLGNPGPQYENTRHNVGVWLVHALAAQYKAIWKLDPKFKGYITTVRVFDEDCKLLLPTTFMNNSGDAVLACVVYYKILPEEILIVHDELDFLPGVIRLKLDGGANGHNGVQNIIDRLKVNNFYRMRIGIGKAFDKMSSKDYVLTKPSKQEKTAISCAINAALVVMPDVIKGNMAKAMQELHVKG